MSGFDESYFRDDYGVDVVRPLSRAWWVSRLYARLVSAWLDRSPGRHRVLEIGCGTGEVLRQLGRRRELAGLDVSEYAVEQCRKTVPFAHCQVGSAEQVGQLYPPASFDVVLAKYVLEHLAEPERALAGCRHVLADGGYLIFAVPNPDSPGRRLKGSAWFGYQDPSHVSLWPPQRWYEALTRQGFEVAFRGGDGLWDPPYLGRVPMMLQRLVFQGPSLLPVLAGRVWLPARWSENLIVVARAGEGDRVA